MINNNQYNKTILQFNTNIQYYQQMILNSSDLNQKSFYENMLKNEINNLNNYQLYYKNANNQNNPKDPKDPKDPNNQNNQNDPNNQNNQREFTIEELSQYDGSNGKPAYAAVNGIVYDLSFEKTWGGGTHFSLYAGKDLSDYFNEHHKGNISVLRNLPKVGILKI